MEFDNSKNNVIVKRPSCTFDKYLVIKKLNGHGGHAKFVQCLAKICTFSNIYTYISNAGTCRKIAKESK